MTEHLDPIPARVLQTYLTEREGETRLGQTIHLLPTPFTQEALSASGAGFVLVGIPEDIGVRANYGKPGTAGFWPEFLKVFLNIQSNRFLTGKEILLAGTVRCDDLMQDARDKQPQELSALVQKLDERVEAVMTAILKSGKIPVVIGGGHNNAYPLIKAAAKTFGRPISILNIDPHADLRATGERHSGNGFSQALEEKLIHYYVQAGLHESYNNTHILEQYARYAGHLFYFSFDDYLKEKWSLNDFRVFVRDHFANSPTGFELDADSIEHFPSSAQTPTGFSTNDARKLTMMTAQEAKPVYFHLPEAIPATTPFNSMKMAAYLVSDFIKNR